MTYMGDVTDDIYGGCYRRNVIDVAKDMWWMLPRTCGYILQRIYLDVAGDIICWMLSRTIGWFLAG